jgi:hypothetical protein
LEEVYYGWSVQIYWRKILAGTALFDVTATRKRSSGYLQSMPRSGLGFRDLVLDDLEYTARNRVSKLTEVIERKDKLSAADKQEFCDLINYLAYYFHDRWTGVWDWTFVSHNICFPTKIEPEFLNSVFGCNFPEQICWLCLSPDERNWVAPPQKPGAQKFRRETNPNAWSE